MDLLSTLSSGLGSGLVVVLNWAYERLGRDGLIGLFLGMLVMLFIDIVRKNLFKLIVISLVLLVIVGVSYSNQHPGEASQGLDIIRLLFNSSSQNITSIVNATK